MNCDMLKTRDNDTTHIERIYGTYQFKHMITEVTGMTSDTSTLIDHIASKNLTVFHPVVLSLAASAIMTLYICC